MIRPATLDDMPVLLAMGRAMHAESPRWRRLKYCEPKVEAMLLGLIESPRGLVLMAERGGEIVGAIAAVAQFAWCSTDLVAEEVSFYMLPEHRGSLAAARLVNSFKEWARLVGASWAYAGASTGVDDERVAQLYEGFGFVRCAVGLEAYFGN
ncbi:GNAT family N-acetyltransferase [Herbaspirillum seropedicae]|uniref:GNAT family N-acetyltransferase n=1 Tax=Herbaspirillum seropedicae TaxID=964 RepID=UPI003FCD04A9